MEFFIYKIVNKINGMSYVGSTNDLKRRWKEHCSERSPCTYLKRALNSYGIENFEMVVIEKTENEDLVKYLECKWILNINSLCPNGYNLVLETGQGRNIHPETKIRMSHGLQGVSKRKKDSSIFLGVRRSSANMFECRICHSRKRYSYRGNNETDAAEAYDKAALFLFGINAKLNFQDKIKDYLKGDLEKFIKEKFNQVVKHSSKYQNISLHKKTGKWRAFYYQDKKQIGISGLFDTEEEAKLARDKYFKIK